MLVFSHAVGGGRGFDCAFAAPLWDAHPSRFKVDSWHRERMDLNTVG